jgi:hypothetical protein
VSFRSKGIIAGYESGKETADKEMKREILGIGRVLVITS